MSARAWVMAIRPPTLLTGLAPVIVGNALGLSLLTEPLSLVHWGVVAATVLAVILLQSAANLVNDVKDAERGIDHAERLGPTRVTQSGLLSAGAIRNAYRGCFLAAMLLSAAIAVRGGWPIILIALLCCVGAYAYTAGPFPLAYHGFGEVAALLFFGPVAVFGCVYLHTLSWPTEIWVWGLGPGLMAASLMAINNFRDRKTDRQAGKTTLAVVFGDRVGRWLPLAFVYLSFAVLAFYAFWQSRLWQGGVALFILIWFTQKHLKPLLLLDGKALNQALKKTSVFNFIYAVCFAAVMVA